MLPKHEEMLNEIKTQISSVAQELVNAMHTCLKGLECQDVEIIRNASVELKVNSTIGNQIDNELVKALALMGAEAGVLRRLISYLKITNELLRTSDNIKSFCKNIIPVLEQKEKLFLLKDSVLLCKTTTLALEYAVSSINAQKQDLDEIIKKVQLEENKTDDLYNILEKNIIDNLNEVQLCSILIKTTNVLRKLERIADRSVNIVKLMYFAKIGGELEIH